MKKNIGVTLTERYLHLTSDDLAEVLVSYENDNFCEIEIVKSRNDYGDFDGYYNLFISYNVSKYCVDGTIEDYQNLTKDCFEYMIKAQE